MFPLFRKNARTKLSFAVVTAQRKVVAHIRGQTKNVMPFGDNSADDVGDGANASAGNRPRKLKPPDPSVRPLNNGITLWIAVSCQPWITGMRLIQPAVPAACETKLWWKHNKNDCLTDLAIVFTMASVPI